jgi:hypothetical protein
MVQRAPRAVVSFAPMISDESYEPELDLRDPALVIAEDYAEARCFEAGEDLSVHVLQARIATLIVDLELAVDVVRRRRRVAAAHRLRFAEERARIRSRGVHGRNSDEREAKVDYQLHEQRQISELAADALRDAMDRRDLLEKQITSYQTLLNAAIRAEEVAHAVDRFV